MEFLKKNWIPIYMLTPLTIMVVYMAYVVIRKEFFDKD